MRILAKALIAHSLLFGAALCASHHPDPGEWGVSSHLLYLSPTMDDTRFVLQSPVPVAIPSGVYKGFDCAYFPAFRVGVVYASCECEREFSVHYTHLQAHQRLTVAGDNLWALVGIPNYRTHFGNYSGTASGHLDYKYHSGNITLSQGFFCCHNVDIAFLAGVESVYFHFNEDYENVRPGIFTGTVTETSKVLGIGPHAGLALEYELLNDTESCPGRLTFNLQSTAGVMATKSSSTNRNIWDGATLLDISETDVCRLIPVLHLQASLGYTACFSCAEIYFELGYELASYLRGISRMIFIGNTSQQEDPSQFYNYDLKGLYLSATVTF